MSFPLIAGKGRSGFTQAKFPKLWAYVEKLESNDGYKRAIQKITEVEGEYNPSITGKS